MTSLIERLLGDPVRRKDTKRLTVVRRPAPIRPRDVFEIFGAMGNTATFEGFQRTVELKEADPRTLIYAVLGRWPSAAELAALPSDYKAWPHLRELILSPEFRAHLPRRICDAFPEKRRLLFVRIPRCAGGNAMASMASYHPVIPVDAGSRSYGNPVKLAPILGTLIARFNTTRTVTMTLDTLQPFLQSAPASPEPGDPLNWRLESSPIRAGDIAFTIVRPPDALVLSEVNAILTGLRRPISAEPASEQTHSDDPRHLAEWRKTLGPLPPPGNAPAWRKLGRRVLAGLPGPKNPICHALGDGQAALAIERVVQSDLHIIGLDRYPAWARTFFEIEALEASNVSEPILRPEDLQPADRAALEDRIAEDRIFYARFAQHYEAAKLPSVRGRVLQAEDKAGGTVPPQTPPSI